MLRDVCANILICRLFQSSFVNTQSQKMCEFRDYDMAVREMTFDRSKRSRPTDRLKSEQELAKEENERLHKLEEERQRRMRVETENDRLDFGLSADALGVE